MTTHLPTTLKLPSLDRHRRASDALSVDLSRPNVKEGDCPLTTAVNNYFKRLAFLGRAGTHALNSMFRSCRANRNSQGTSVRGVAAHGSRVQRRRRHNACGSANCP